MIIDDEAMDKAQLTLLLQEFTYRDGNGAEQKAMRVLPWGKLKYDQVAGAEQEFIVPVTIGFEGIDSTKSTQLKVLLENHPGVVAEDGSEGGMHFFGGA